MSEPERPDDLLSVRQVARMWNVDEETVYRWAKKGVFPTQTVAGRVLRIRRSDAEAQIVRRSVDGENPQRATAVD